MRIPQPTGPGPATTVAERLHLALHRSAFKSRRALHQRLKTLGIRGSSYASVHTYFDGKVSPPPAFLRAAAKELGVREAWLIAGDGEPTVHEASFYAAVAEHTPTWISPIDAPRYARLFSRVAVLLEARGITDPKARAHEILEGMFYAPLTLQAMEVEGLSRPADDRLNDQWLTAFLLRMGWGGRGFATYIGLQLLAFDLIIPDLTTPKRRKRRKPRAR